MVIFQYPDYGSSFPDVVQSLVHVRESLASNHVSTTSGFKYKDNLEKQVSTTKDDKSISMTSTCQLFSKLILQSPGKFDSIACAWFCYTP